MSTTCVTPMAIRTLTAAVNVCMTIVLIVFAFYSFAGKQLSKYDLLGWYGTLLAMLGLVVVQLLVFVYAEFVPDWRQTPSDNDENYEHLNGRTKLGTTSAADGGASWFAWRFEPGAKHETWEQLATYLVLWLLVYIYHYLFDGHQPYTITGDVLEDSSNAATWRIVMAAVILLGLRLLNLHVWIWTYVLGTFLLPVRATVWVIMGVASWTHRSAGYLFGHRVSAYDDVEMSGGGERAGRWGRGRW